MEPCNWELPHLQQISDELHDKNFVMLAIARKRPRRQLDVSSKSIISRSPWSADPDRSIYGKYATEAIPRTYLISRDGAIIYQITGFYEEELPKLKASIQAELDDAYAPPSLAKCIVLVRVR